MKTLNRFEANLMSILYAILDERPADSVQSHLEKEMEKPPCLSRETVEMVKDVMGKGFVRWLAKADWRKEKFLRDEEVNEGRLWERWSASELGLSFSGHSLEFLIAITAADGRSNKFVWKPRGKQSMELGDWMLLFKSADTFCRSRVGRAWFRFPVLHQNPLICLAMPHLTNGKTEFSEWMTGTRAAILEALQGELAQKWVRLEQEKSNIRNHQGMLDLGLRQTLVLSSYMDTCEKAQRRDLCRFLLVAMRTLVGLESVKSWVNMDLSQLRLADRKKVYEATASFLSVAERLRKWHQSCQGIGYFDEGYAAAQLWLEDWERYDGERVMERAKAMKQELVEF